MEERIVKTRLQLAMNKSASIGAYGIPGGLVLQNAAYVMTTRFHNENGTGAIQSK